MNTFEIIWIQLYRLLSICQSLCVQAHVYEGNGSISAINIFLVTTSLQHGDLSTVILLRV